MSDSPELPVLVHELGGMLSTIQGFAHIAAASPEHPERERYIALTASEARRAAQTVKDIHLVLTFDGGRVPPSPPPVPLAALLEGVARQAPEVDLSSIAAPEVAVVADPSKLASPLARCMAQATTTPSVRETAPGVEISFGLASADELVRRNEALEAPYPDMVVFSLARRLLRHWGGELTLAADGSRTVATILLAGG